MLYFGLFDYLQELHETEKMQNILGVLYEGGGERRREGVTFNSERERDEDTGTTLRLKRRKRIVELWLFRINLSCTIFPISKEEGCYITIVRSVRFFRFSLFQLFLMCLICSICSSNRKVTDVTLMRRCWAKDEDKPSSPTSYTQKMLYFLSFM